MLGDELKGECLRAEYPLALDPGELDATDDWDEIEPGSRPIDIWDAFELDDDLDEPLPEYGDFWPEPDEEEI